MNISAIVIVIVIAIAIVISNIGSAPDQSGGVLPQISYKNPMYNRQYRELDNVDNVLNRPMVQGDSVTASLQAYNSAEVWACADITHSEVGAEARAVSETIKDKIETHQPYFLKEPLIIDHYGEKFYWDARYPKQPISIDFQRDPEKYIRDRPNEYPSYVIASRNYDLIN